MADTEAASEGDRPFTFGWRAAIVIALLAALFGGGATARERSVIRDLERDVKKLRSEVNRLEAENRKLERRVRELAGG